MKDNKLYSKFMITAAVTAFMMLVVLIGIVKMQPTVSCAALGGIMTVLTAYLWKSE